MLGGIMLLAWLGSPPVSPVIGKSLPKIKVAPLLMAESENMAGPTGDSVEVLYLWGPWNEESCSGYLKIAKLYQKFESNPRIRFLLVAFAKDILDTEQLRAQAQVALDQAGFRMPVFYDPEGQTSMELALLMPYGSMGFPTTIVTDKSNKIVRLIEGDSVEDFDELERFLVEYSQSQE